MHGSFADAIHEHAPELTLGGWANPHADAEAQVDFLGDEHFGAEFFLTQIVSHHDIAHVERFLEAFDRRRLSLPGVVGVFFYRSANPKTLDALRHFLPVPVDALRREFADGATPEEVCARTIAQRYGPRSAPRVRVKSARGKSPADTRQDHGSLT